MIKLEKKNLASPNTSTVINSDQHGIQLNWIKNKH